MQALLRLARARSTDEELQYKAALTVGHLAANAVKLLPKGITAPVSFSGTAEGGIPPHLRRAAAAGTVGGAGAGAGGERGESCCMASIVVARVLGSMLCSAILGCASVDRVFLWGGKGRGGGKERASLLLLLWSLAAALAGC